MTNFRRGREAIDEAASRKGGGGGRFVPEIFWKEDGEKKYVLILTPIDEVTELDLHAFLPVEREKANGGTYKTWESVIARTDVAIGEDDDPLADQFELTPRTRLLGAAVELDPTFKVERGRKRPKGFTVKTSTFTRKTDDGEEDVETPNIGIIVQSSSLVWSPLKSLDEEQGPLSELPVEIIRRGTELNTRYDFVPFIGQPVDLAPLIDNLDGIGYLSDDLPQVLSAVEAEDNDLGAAVTIARALFEKRLDELADRDHYDEIMENLDESELPSGRGSKRQEDKPRPKRGQRPARKSPRETTTSEDGSDDAVADTNESNNDPSPDEKTERFKELRARIGADK